jgi:NAD(P)H-nitrite reductase large subunit
VKLRTEGESMGRYVIVGNGVAGTRAAEVLRRTDADAAITLVTEEAYPFYRRPQLADFAAGQAGEVRLWANRSRASTRRPMS